MEDALRVDAIEVEKLSLKSLNTCSNGRCSASFGPSLLFIQAGSVLILVLMEDALREHCYFSLRV